MAAARTAAAKSALVGGFVVGVVSLRLQRLRTGGKLDKPPATPEEYRRAIVGRTKAKVAHLLGPPRTALLDGVPPADAGDKPVYLQADIWYYAIDAAARSAIAVRFRNGVALAVDVFKANAPERDETSV